MPLKTAQDDEGRAASSPFNNPDYGGIPGNPMKPDPLSLISTDQTDGIGTVCGCVLMAMGCGVLWLAKGLMEVIFL